MPETTSDKEVVDFIHDLFEDSRRWVKGTLAKDPYGTDVPAKSDNACSFCLSGAVSRYATSPTQRARILRLLEKYLPNEYKGIPSFNDAKKTAIEDVRHVLKSVSLHFKHSH